ncbi:hypothetical protein GDO81_005429, partial [Engystomops pustulosus]
GARACHPLPLRPRARVWPGSLGTEPAAAARSASHYCGGKDSGEERCTCCCCGGLPVRGADWVFMPECWGFFLCRELGSSVCLSTSRSSDEDDSEANDHQVDVSDVIQLVPDDQPELHIQT